MKSKMSKSIFLKKVKFNGIYIAVSVIILATLSCKNNSEATVAQDSKPEVAFTTQEQQVAYTPDKVLEELKKGDKDFSNGIYKNQDHIKEAVATADGQYPKAVVLSCLDSRVPVETIFNEGIGDLFVGRVVGNIEDENMIGSFEFGTAVAGAKLIVGLGHTSCGAVKHAVAQTDAKSLGMNALGDLLAEINPAVTAVLKAREKRDSKNKALLNNAIEKNVELTISDSRTKSPTLTKLENEGKLKIVGAVYDIETRKIKWL